MNRPNSTGSFYAPKALSLHSSSVSDRNSPPNLASFIGSRQNRHRPFRSRVLRSGELRDFGPPDEPDHDGIQYGQRQQQQQYSDEPFEKQEDNYEEEDTMSVHSRASTPRQQSREVHFTPGKSGSPGKQQNAVNPMRRIPDFQEIFDNEDDIFEDDDTPSFSETTVTIPNKVLDNMRLPLPAPGQMIIDSPVPWGKLNRKKSEDSEIMEIKPEVYHARSDSASRSGLEKVVNTERRLEAGWQDEDEELGRRGETESFSDYDSKVENEADYDEGGPIQQQEADGLEYYDANYNGSNEGSDYDDQKDGPGIWSEGNPTISSRGWLDRRNKDSLESFAPPPKLGEEPHLHANGKGKEKSQAQDQIYDNGVQRLEYHAQEQGLLPLALRNTRPWSDTTAGEALDLGSRAMAKLAVQAAGRGGHTPPTKEVATISGNRVNNENHRSPSTSNNIDLTPLLTEYELSTVPTYALLLAALSNLRSKNHTTIPPSQLPSELEELAKSYYPHDSRMPEKFFNKLDDKQNALAGEYILGKKRELEGKLADVTAKRRKVMEVMKEEVEKAAEVRVAKLRRTEERRELLKGGIGKMLKEGGLWL